MLGRVFKNALTGFFSSRKSNIRRRRYGRVLTFEPTAEQFWRFVEISAAPVCDRCGLQRRELWITDLKRGRYRAKESLTEEFIDTFTHNISDCVNKQFNHANKILEADTREMRISIIHDYR